MSLYDSEKTAKLNDLFRSYLGTRRTEELGTVIITQGVQTLNPEDQAAIFALVKDFKDFSEGDDPYEERDFGAVTHKNAKYFWKIDYYDPDLTRASLDPSDPDKTYRILTIMRADEY